MAQKLYTNMSLMVTPTDGKHIVNKDYVDLAVNRKIKDAVVAVSASNIDAAYDSTAKTLTQNSGSEAAFVVDGVTLAEGDRLLVAGQTDGTQNGIYVVTTNGDDTTPTAGVLTRAEDFDETGKIPHNVIIPVMQGSNADTNWQLTTDGAITLDSTNLTFTKFKGSEGAMTHTETITGDGTATEFTITHGLGTENVTVSIVDAATKEKCVFAVEITSENVVTLKSDIALENTESFIVTVIG